MKTKFFRVAVEGATATDGRTIDRQMIEDSVAMFNRDTYGPRINMEHIRGLSADGPFKAFGDVLALKSDTVDLELDGKTEKRVALFAQFDVTDDLVEINKKRQKIYTSCEFAPNFGGTTKFGLAGIGVTDSPASLGTEALSFSALKPMFDGRKMAPGNFFSAAEGGTLEFEEAPAADSGMGAFFTEARALLSKIPGFSATAPKQDDAAAAATAAAAAAAAGGALDLTAFTTAFTGAIDKLSQGFEAATTRIAGDVTALRTELGQVKASIDTTDASSRTRPLATGADGNSKYTKIDC